MRFSFDLDGVCYERPEVFAAIAHALQSAGHEVGVLSGHRNGSGERTLDKLESLGFPRMDFFFGRRPEDMDKNGAVRKSQVIEEEGIALHFDDYDFNNTDTIRLFRELGQEGRVARVTSSLTWEEHLRLRAERKAGD